MPLFHLTHAAKASLRSIGRYTEAKWGKTQRNTYLYALDNCFHTIAQFPMKGRARDELFASLRSYHEGKHVIFYLPHREDIIIVDILHERMDPSLHLSIDLS